VSIKNDGHYFCRAGGNRPDGLNEPVTFIYALMGAERILFSVDYPYQTLDGVKTFIDSLPVNKAEKEAIAFRNAERLLGITA
ncbi:amidohydrolase family protein, partial [Escherichia coli]|uniref:amidohydrolase family protein n=1 Tax=Escherichia coli TaxID=562 RepID=UPI00202CBF4F